MAALLVSAGGAQAATSKFSGSIAGYVRDGAGIPQMGATVLLFDRHDKLIQKGLTNERGVFGFAELLPDLYSIHVTLASFVPALKQRIAVQAGLQSLLYINMASILSSIELVYAAPGQGALMSDDWKWTLKTSLATRPVLRLAPDLVPADRPRPSAIFSETRGLVKVSAGDGDSFGDAGAESDVGTAFALATSLFGRNQIKVSGNVGHSAHTGVPAASLRTTYSHDGSGAEVAVTMRQIYLPARGGVFAGQQDGLPALRTMSVAMTDRLDFTDDLHLEYGLSLDSVSFLDHLNYFSPFARLTYDMGRLGKLQAAYSSGAPPAELFTRPGEPEAALRQDLAALALAPRISVRDGRVKAERTQNVELGLEKKIGSRTLDFTGYREVTSNGALLLSGDLLPTGDVLPDLSSSANIFNYGGRTRYGYAASMTQEVGEHLEVAASAGRGGAIVAEPELPSASADALRSAIRTGNRYWAAVRATGTIPGSGTQISARYQWMDYNCILPEHLYLTQKNYPEPGLNIHIRQPIPSFPGMPGRLEATAELRNLVAQGYLPFTTPDNRRLLLVQSPRAVRGGLSFIF